MHLWGFRYSVYTWIARMAIAERGLIYSWTEVNPFDPADANPHPFGRVPMIEHEGQRIYEVSAITTYLDQAIPGPNWTPVDPLAQARVVQVIGIVDSYGYWAMVRDVFGPGVFSAATERGVDLDRVANGLKNSRPVLAALDDIAREGYALSGPLTRADLHLAPMLSYFSDYPEAAHMLADHPKLALRFDELRARPSFVETKPDLPKSDTD